MWNVNKKNIRFSFKLLSLFHELTVDQAGHGTEIIYNLSVLYLLFIYFFMCLKAMQDRSYIPRNLIPQYLISPFLLRTSFVALLLFMIQPYFINLLLLSASFGSTKTSSNWYPIIIPLTKLKTCFPAQTTSNSSNLV